MREKLLEKLKEIKLKKLLIWFGVVLLMVVIGGWLVREFMLYMLSFGDKVDFELKFIWLLSPYTWLIGVLSVTAGGIVYFFSSNNLDRLFGGQHRFSPGAADAEAVQRSVSGPANAKRLRIYRQNFELKK